MSMAGSGYLIWFGAFHLVWGNKFGSGGLFPSQVCRCTCTVLAWTPMSMAGSGYLIWFGAIDLVLGDFFPVRCADASALFWPGCRCSWLVRGI